MSVLLHEGNVVYLNAPRIGESERRTDALNDVRVIVDAALELKQQVNRLQAIVRTMWPDGYPVPPEVISVDDCATKVNAFADYAISRARGGVLKVFGERANG